MELLPVSAVSEDQRLSRCVATREQIDGLCSANPLPEARKGCSWLKYSVLSTYRVLFLVALTANIIAICCTIGVSADSLWSFSYGDATTAVAANLLVATMMRQEHVINFLFRAAISLPHSTPLGVRRAFAKIYCHGGLHSGCGVSAALWYVVFAVLSIRQFRPEDKQAFHALIGTMAVMLGLFVVQISLSIHPKLRSRYHDLWELSHRFAGWAAVAVIWAQIILITIVNAKANQRSVGIVLVQTPSFWFLTLITCFIVYPWLRLRRVKVKAERLSDHATRLWFDQYSVPTCVGIRLSRHPLLDNHGFATIPNEDDEKGYSVLVSRAGDFTKGLINDAPTHIWKRGAHTIGVARVALMFQRLVLVATGSGIGPCLSFLQVHPNWPVRVVWSTRDPLATYGERVMRSVLRADPKAIIINTSATGRPLLLNVVYGLAIEFQAEAVVIISNPVSTREVVYGLESRGKAAFGAIFDS